MNSSDIQLYKRLLLAKLDELSTLRADADPHALGAGGSRGDLADQANADAEADLHIRLHQTGTRLLRAIEDASARISQDRFGVCEVCKQDISKARLELAMDGDLQGLQGIRPKLMLPAPLCFPPETVFYAWPSP